MEQQAFETLIRFVSAYLACAFYYIAKTTIIAEKFFCRLCFVRKKNSTTHRSSFESERGMGSGGSTSKMPVNLGFEKILDVDGQGGGL